MSARSILFAFCIFLVACIPDEAVKPDGGDAGGGDAPSAQTLTVTLAGNGTGNVSSSPAGIDCGTTCSAAFAPGTSVVLTATPDANMTFDGWSGGGCSGTTPCTVSITAATTVTATFSLQKIKLTITPKGNGSVKSLPTGIDCGATCTASFDYGTQITLSPIPAAGISAFGGWSGGGCTGVSNCVVKMTIPLTISATFLTLATWDPTWSVAGVTYSNGDLSISGNSSGNKNVRTTFGVTAGKTYWEINVDAGVAANDAGGLGICESIMPNYVAYIGSQASGLAWGYGTFPQYFVSWSGVTVNGAPPTTSYVAAGIVYMFALDMTGGKLWAGQDGSWYNSGNPTANTNPIATGITGTVYPGVTFYQSSGNAFTANFGGSPFKYPVPSGFQAGFFQ